MEAKKILIVEDENIVARDIEHSLNELGYQVPAIASCGEEAVEKAGLTAPDLILMDIMLKGDIDGISAVQAMRDRMDVPVVYLTACADRDTLDRAKATEPFGYLLKPFEEKELQTAVEMALYRHDMEKKLKENKDWFALTLQCMGQGVIVTNKEGKITLMNPIAESLTGWKHEEAMGKEWDEILQLEDEQTREKVPSILNELMKGRSAVLISKDGREIPIVEKTGLLHEGQLQSGFVISFLDITDRKLSEKLKDEFVSTVSHELRTPMMIIRESISQVLDGLHGETNDKQKNFLSLSLRGIDRLSRIVNALLDMSKIEAGQMEFKREQIHFNRLVNEVAASFSIPAKQRGLEIRQKLPKGKIPIYVDRDKISQLLTNLIGNALKFTDKGWIEISVTALPDVMQCSVKDTGIGISQDALPKVFNKFQQFDAPVDPSDKGTGLGLAICKGIVELHHGTIGIESELGKGTTFTFTLPQISVQEILKEYAKHGIKDSSKYKVCWSSLFFSFEGYGSSSEENRKQKN